MARLQGQQRRGHPHRGGHGLEVLTEEERHDVARAVRRRQGDAALPREVVEADVVEREQVRGHPEQVGESPLEAHGDVAQPHGAVAGLEQRARHDADRVGEVDDPRVRLRVPTHRLGDVEHHRHGAQRLGEAAGPGRLLSEAAGVVRPRLVAVPCGLPADPQLEEHGVRVGDAGHHVAGRDDLHGVAGPGEHALGHGRHDREALGVRIDEPQLIQREVAAQPCEPVDELRRVGGPTADDCDLHIYPFTPVRVMPSTNTRCANRKSRITGTVTSTVIAIVMLQSVPWTPRNVARP